MEVGRKVGIKSLKASRTLGIRITENDPAHSLIGPAARYLDHIDLSVQREIFVVAGSCIIAF